MRSEDEKTMVQAACIEVKDVSIARGKQMVLEAVNFSACASEVVAIIGPNGAGKSSLLKALSGELAPEAGELLLHGRSLPAMSLEERACCIAALSQHSSLSFPFTVQEVVELGRMPHDNAAVSHYELCKAAMLTSDCWHLRPRLYPQLSGGEQQRVQLARIFAQAWPRAQLPPQYVLLDEPSASLDLHHQQLLLEYCRQRAAQNAIVLLAVHDLNLACRYADRILLLADGQLRASGSPWEVCQPELLQEVYKTKVQVLGHPDVNCPLVFL